MSAVFDFNASPNNVAPVSLILLPVDVIRIEKSGLLMNAFCAFFLLSSQPRSSSVSVVFDINDSLNDVAPVSPIPLTGDVKRMEELITDGCLLCAFLSFVLPLRSSFVSVVFDFNASPNDVVPVSPILFPVDTMRTKSELLMNGFFVSSFVFTTQIKFGQCCV